MLCYVMINLLMELSMNNIPTQVIMIWIRDELMTEIHGKEQIATDKSKVI
jgi:hypothetical protein